MVGRSQEARRADGWELQSFADKLERASTETIEAGIMTKDIASIADVYDKKGRYNGRIPPSGSRKTSIR